MYYQNMRSIRDSSRTRTLMINALISDYGIILLSETWLPDYIQDSELGLNSYIIYRCDRDYRRRDCNRSGTWGADRC